MQICRLTDLSDPGSRQFQIGEGDWPLRAFLVRVGEQVRAYRNRCPHAGHPLNLRPDQFLTRDGRSIICSSHAAEFELLDGVCSAGPCRGRHLEAIPVTVDGDWIVLDGTFRMEDYSP